MTHQLGLGGFGQFGPDRSPVVAQLLASHGAIRFPLDEHSSRDAAGLAAVGDVSQMAGSGSAPEGKSLPCFVAGEAADIGLEFHESDYTIQCPPTQHFLVPAMRFTVGVKNDQSLIRRDNLSAFVGARKWTINDLEREAGYGRYTYWRDLLNGTKPFGERAARKIEEAFLDLGMMRGQLDSDDSEKLSNRAVLIGKDFDRIPPGDMREAVYARVRKLLEEAALGRLGAAQTALLDEPTETLSAHR